MAIPGNAFHIITEYFRAGDTDRQQELDTCLANNLSNPEVSCMILCVEDEDMLPESVRREEKVIMKVYPGRPTFNELLSLAAVEAAAGNIVSIQNSDIYWAAEDVHLVQQHLQEGECYALSRWDVLPDGEAALNDVNYSQDTWVFRGRMYPVPALSCKLGMLAVDNVVAYELYRAGYKISNPSYSIRTYHVHHFGIRKYKDEAGNLLVPRLPPPHLSLSPHELGEPCRLKFTYPQGSIRYRWQRLQTLLGSILFFLRPRRLAICFEVPEDALSDRVTAFMDTVRVARIPCLLVVTPPANGAVPNNKLQADYARFPEEIRVLRAHILKEKERNDLAMRRIRKYFPDTTHVLQITDSGLPLDKLTGGLNRLLLHPSYYNRVLLLPDRQAFVYPLRRRISFSQGKRMNWGSVIISDGKK